MEETPTDKLPARLERPGTGHRAPGRRQHSCWAPRPVPSLGLVPVSVSLTQARLGFSWDGGCRPEASGGLQASQEGGSTRPLKAAKDGTPARGFVACVTCKGLTREHPGPQSAWPSSSDLCPLPTGGPPAAGPVRYGVSGPWGALGVGREPLHWDRRRRRGRPWESQAALTPRLCGLRPLGCPVQGG